MLWELATDGGGTKEAPDIVDAESIVEAGVSVRPLIDESIDFEDDFVDVELIEPFFETASGVSSDTIFMPTDVPVDAGMNNVVIPFFLITVLWG